MTEEWPVSELSAGAGWSLGLADHTDARARPLMRALDREAQGRSPPNVTGATPISPTCQEGGEGA